MKTLAEIADDIAYWWHAETGGKAVIAIEPDKADVGIQLFHEDGDEYYIANYVEPGLSLSDAGSVQVCGEERQLVCVNSAYHAAGFGGSLGSIVMEAIGRHIVGWVLGAF